MKQAVEEERLQRALQLASRLPRSRSLVSLFAQQRAAQAVGEEGQLVVAAQGGAGSPAEEGQVVLAAQGGAGRQGLEEEAAVFELPDKPVRKAGKADLLALCAVGQNSTGPPGRQGSWKPGPGRPRKAAKVGRPPKAFNLHELGAVGLERSSHRV